MSNNFTENLTALVETCERQMRVEGWGAPAFDEDNFKHLPSYSTCVEIDSLITGSFRLKSLQEFAADFRRRSEIQVTTLNHLKIYQEEALILDVLPDVAIRYALERHLATTVGYIGVRPVLDEKSGQHEPPYGGPFIFGALMTGFSFCQEGSSDSHAFTNQFALLQIRKTTFPSVFLEHPVSHQMLN